MLITIAWRNIWRSRTRSLVVMAAIVIGIWALAFMISFSLGMARSYVSSAIENSLSHLQAHHPQFGADAEARYYLDVPIELQEEVRKLPEVQNTTARTLLTGMLTTGKSPRGIQIRGIDPAGEAAVTRLNEKIVAGAYLSDDNRRQILIGERLAQKMGAKIRSKVVLTFQDVHGNITAGAFRVGGLFNTGNRPFDEGTVFVDRRELNELFGPADAAHEMAIYLRDPETLADAQRRVQQELADAKVENYREISPDVLLYESQIQTSATIFIVIIMLALLFGIINTMLMAVLERYHELGMLMAIGMNKGRVFAMIVLETLLLSGAGSLPGLLLGWLTVTRLQHTGIDLSSFSQSMEQFGLSQMVYPSLNADMYLQLAAAVVVTALVGAIYPAWKAIRLRPVEAIGH